jgi:hypothetical protein
MGERIRDDIALLLTLDPVVADRAGGIETFFEIALLQIAGRPLGIVGPDAESWALSPPDGKGRAPAHPFQGLGRDDP